ncbi:MAG TPA: tRNA lysidine(34) synthetase TilS, partial [Kofleriaceae bacterium]|nr:tRNA lysidine(34) synthetase TilS [Kofleriaceae bacterium]
QIAAHPHARQPTIVVHRVVPGRQPARVRVRRDLLPALRRENPQLDAALIRLASSAAEWLEVIDGLARPFARFPLDAAALAGRPAGVRKRALAMALEAAGLDYDASHLDRLDGLVVAPERGEIAIDLPGGAVVRSYGTVSVVVAGTVSGDEPTGPTPLALDASHAGHELRAWRPGDRMRPARLKGRSRKLSDLYIDAKVPRAARRRARVLVRSSDATIVWAEHVGLAYGESRAIAPLPTRSDGKF